MCPAQCRRAQKAGVAAAARCIRLQHVHGAGAEHALEVSRVVAIFAGSDSHRRRCAVTQQPQPFEVVRAHGLLEPGYIVVRQALRYAERLFAVVGAVSVDEQCDVGPHGLGGDVHAVRVGGWPTADLHFDHADAAVGPGAQLLSKPALVVGCEAAAAIHRYVFACATKQVAERDA